MFGGGSISRSPAGAVLLSVRCRLVRGMQLQHGHLLISAQWIRFEPAGPDDPDPAEPRDSERDSTTGWARDGEPESKELPRPRAWAVAQLRELLPRRYLLRRVALELFLVGGASHFLCFAERETRRRVHKRILGLRPPLLDPASTYVNYGRSLLESRHQQLLEDWQQWRVSNFDYIMRLNTLAGRTYNDLTQYPVFPWVIKDFTSGTLDLEDPKIYRDFSKPVGAQHPTQAARFAERYDSYEDAGMGSQPFHYGSHYSSAGIVLHYLIRLEPFATEHINLQGGRFDVADRLFDDVSETWQMCQSSMSDVKELIPEFFCCPDFLRNVSNLPLGTMQNGHVLGDVTLPPWAKTPEDFVRIQREALESDYVSQHLHLWVDLIFGHKQRGDAAREAINVFYYLTYEGAVNLDVLEPKMRRAVEAQIQFFGQTPSQLLSRPHPRRRPRSAVGAQSHMFARAEAVKVHGPYWLGGRRGARRPEPAAASVSGDALDFICAVPLDDRLLSITRGGRLFVHRWFPLKPDGGGQPFTFEPASSPLLTLPEASPAARTHGGGGGPTYCVSSDGKWLLSGGHWDNALRCTSLTRPELVVAAHLEITLHIVSRRLLLMTAGTFHRWSRRGSTRARSAASTPAPTGPPS